MPASKKVKSQNRKAVFVRDKLYIDDKLHLTVPTETCNSSGSSEGVLSQISLISWKHQGGFQNKRRNIFF